MKSQHERLMNVLAMHEHQRKRKKILVLADDPDLLTFMRSSLQSGDLLVLTITDPFEAIKSFIQETPAVAFVDMELLGLEAMKAFRMLDQVNSFRSKIVLMNAKAATLTGLGSIISDVILVKPPVSPAMLRKIVDDEEMAA